MTTRTEQSALQLASRLSTTILTTLFVGIDLVTAVRILSTDTSLSTRIIGVLYVLALLLFQLLHLSRHSARLRGHGGLAVLAGLTYLPFVQCGEAWVGIPGFLAGSVLLVLPAAPAWVAFGAVVLSMGVLQGMFDPSPLSIGYTMASTMIIGLVVYGLTRLTELIREVSATGAELTRGAVAQERLRVARDLHDLLGYSLSAITLKSELTYRLLLRNPDLARHELSETLFISRKALADVRGVAAGYRELSFDEEAHSARSVLAAADVAVTMDLAYDDLPIRVSTVLAIVLREGVANLLRHSKAENCEIVVRQTVRAVRIDIVNDGVRSVAGDEPVRLESSCGIQNLSLRVMALDGLLTTGLDPDGRFRLTAVVPLTSGPTPRTPGAGGAIALSWRRQSAANPGRSGVAEPRVAVRSPADTAEPCVATASPPQWRSG